MLVILSQKVDSQSSYADELFSTYHYPARYCNQLHEGDVFIYYQGNRYNRNQRYYFGSGIVGKIIVADKENYYATLEKCKKFDSIVPIYLPNGGYIEQLGYRSVRSSINPPWQSSVRPLSQEAYEYILKRSVNKKSMDALKEEMKKSIRDFYIGGDISAIFKIEELSSTIINAVGATENKAPLSPNILGSNTGAVKKLMDYCRKMNMSYSYKPVLIMSLLDMGNGDGSISVANAVKYFRNFYEIRRQQGKLVERKNCIYMNSDVTDSQIASNMISNPIHALIESDFFFFDMDQKLFSLNPAIWRAMNLNEKAELMNICSSNIDKYYQD